MAKVYSIHYHHHFNSITSLHQYRPTHKPNLVTHSPTSLALAAVIDRSPEKSQLSTLGICFLNEANEFRSLSSVKLMHAQGIKMGKSWNSDIMVKSLILYYLEFGDFNSAAKIFFFNFSRNYTEWKSFLEEYKRFGGDVQEILEVFSELHGKGVVFDSRILTIVLKICTSAMESWLGVEVHASFIKRGLDIDVYLKCALMNFYGKCWGVESANKVFHEAPILEHDLLWNEAIIVNLRNERSENAFDLFREMQFLSFKANSRTIVKMLQACGKVGTLSEGKQIHGYVLKSAMESNFLICNSLISMYSRNNKLELARKAFDSMTDHSLSSWNSMISSYTALGYVDDAWDLFNKMDSSNIQPDIITWNCLLSGHFIHGSYKEVLTILHKMQNLGFRPNASSISIVLQAVTDLGLLKYGRENHAYILRNGLDFDVYVCTSLIDMYVKNDCLHNAQAVFDNTKNRNIVAWNSLISGYSFKGLFDDTQKLLNQMQEEGVKPDLVTWNGLVSGYSIRGQSKEALDVIHQMKNSGLDPNVISWTSLISGSSQNENYRESLEFFVQMQQEDIRPNSTTMSSLLRTCGGLGLLHNGKEIHCFCLKNGFINDAYVTTALIDMYGKSGNLKCAHEIFRKNANKTLASWNCMIMGFAIYGHGKEAISLFHDMLEAGISPDAITFTALLSACKNSGLVEEGWKYFDSMSADYSIMPTIEHYSCMVDLLGKAGYLDEAWDFIRTMPFKADATIWGALLGSCRIHRNMEYGEIAAQRLFALEPYNSANYFLMMNLFAMSNRWEDVEQLKDLMAKIGVKNGLVWSWIQIDQMVHVFSAEGAPHPDTGEIYFELYHLVSEMKKLGYVPDTSCVYQDIDEAEKEKVLLSHTEKLAITYGLIKTKSRAPIRVIKNTRICSDCHTAAEYMSLVRGREIFLRDGVRFHHFREGKCSCNDYWQ
ncbi:putative Pentatricopeptide repeat-containing protein [Melia azedarach]|uniref:Pentatricopeptide repeat-containing protein n=1 Tax=Melia azedarach TaxID=155640 RepID=A0ACC1YWD7_MELAZ|nr:putative Pentatricopeptide repeat-containing protein [Melia azedarach]